MTTKSLKAAIQEADVIQGNAARKARVLRRAEKLIEWAEQPSLTLRAEVQHGAQTIALDLSSDEREAVIKALRQELLRQAQEQAVVYGVVLNSTGEST